MVIRHHRRIASGQVRYGNTDHSVDDLVRVCRTGLFDGLDPHVEADVMRFHRIICYTLLVLDELVPGINEFVVLLTVDAHEVVPCRQMANQRCGVDTGQLLFTNRKGDDRDIIGGYTLVTQFLVERDIGITVDR